MDEEMNAENCVTLLMFGSMFLPGKRGKEREGRGRKEKESYLWVVY